MKTLVLFDFDGTITRKDTLFEMAKLTSTPITYWFKLGLVSPFLVLMKLKLLSNHQAKERFMRAFFGGMDHDKFEAVCQQFVDKRLPGIIRNGALEEIEKHQKENHKLYVVSASATLWIKPWTDHLGIGLIATQLEIVDQKITGFISGENCNGEEKVNRIKETETLESYDQVIAYGDSSGDLPMLELAHEKHYKPFR